LTSKSCFNVDVQQERMDRVEMANNVKRILFLSSDVKMCRPTVQCRYMRMRSVAGLIPESEDQTAWKFVCLFLARQPSMGLGLLIRLVYRSHTTTDHSL
jgi:hypothetical protein